ncbi:FAD-dependent monooxygenase [Microbispora cellulosiformans]|uniref:FAD-dependent monooxygenase n=1 Tax=Microbispora cellulosiformans TaxID=2614688 RepID=A0A5J5K2T9_9ACTN|nr:NAD(P)/FAD-dependent oxidoreductase [Microbispora cellulosiformans]KAA9377420.1 FAD-dependent monooxygenase [Microbispora cellulosiformans]
MQVLIIGGGIGGLSLAQGLRKAGVGVALYERDGSPFFRGQGWRISIKEDGSAGLRACLPDDLFDLCVATSLRPATRMAFLDHRLVPKFEKPIPPLPGDRFFGVNRLTLREILLAGLDGIVHFGAEFVRYDHLPDGRVRAHFADGTSAVGDLLVGADGTGSRVRRQLLPEAVVDDAGVFVYGRTPITPGMLERVPAILVDTFNRLIDPAGPALSVATCRAGEAPPGSPAVRLTPVPAYFAWQVSCDGGWGSAADLRQADAATLHRAALEAIAGFHPAARGIVEGADVSATFPVAPRTARPVEPWTTGNVTLLGDAIHSMSPGRGEGANVTLRDAALLTRTLAEAAARDVPVPAALAEYEREMLRYGFAAVAASRDQPFMPRRFG